MKIRIVLMVFVSLFFGERVVAQISYGGTPLFPDDASFRNATLLKSSGSGSFISMPAFDLDSVLQADAVKQEAMRGGFRFAYKFHTHIERGKDGNEWTLADGTRVWQVGIHSQGAYSINLLFTEYHVPEGAQLFLYNADHSYIIGSFDHRNNSLAGVLPVRPVAGESIIVEYSEPAGAAFAGRLVIGEVNHDYRGILRVEPYPDPSDGTQDCMPDVLCHEGVDEGAIRSTLLMIINGNTRCSGVLLNNTTNDGTPYVLTAIHCLNGKITDGVKQNLEYYIEKAQTIVVFFNYNRPVCGSLMKATEELSLAGAYPRAIIEEKDIALLEMHEKPPPYYNACYAGWNVDASTLLNAKPYTNLHHPEGAVKKYGFYDDNLSWMTFTDPAVFDANSHLRVEAWTIGSTWKGSSGSPLFDARYRVVGGLTGGWSQCGSPHPSGKTFDSFFALERGWTTNNPANQLKTYLDPWNTGLLSIDGMNPNHKTPLLRTGNAGYNNGDELITTKYTSPNSGFLFGNSNQNIVEFAEEFNPNPEDTIKLYGVYLLIPPLSVSATKGVEIRVYEGDSQPERLIATQNLKPQFLNYSSSTGFELIDKNMNTAATENFVLFDEPVKINSKFFIAYRIDNAPGSSFVVYNSKLQLGKLNTSWINQNETWVRSTEYKTQPVVTSLAIQVLSNNARFNSPEREERTKIQYIRVKTDPYYEPGLLFLPETNLEAGEVFVYTVSGQLQQRISLAKGQDVVALHSFRDGFIGVVRVVRGKNVYMGKFIY